MPFALCKPYSFANALLNARFMFFRIMPKTSLHRDKVQETRKAVRAITAGLGHVTIIEREKNLGCSQSIISGVSQLIEEYGRAIVLEDDLVVSPSFLDYMLQGLERYENDPRVGQIAGYMYPLRLRSKQDAVFLPFITSWGWATWKRVWQEVDWSAADAQQALSDPALKDKFDLQGHYHFSKIMDLQLSGQIDTWDVQFYWATFKAKQVALFPCHTLVWNGGFDGSGTHCDPNPAMQAKQENVNYHLLNTICFPENFIVDDKALLQVKKYLKNSLDPLTIKTLFLKSIKKVFGNTIYDNFRDIYRKNKR